MIITYLLTTYYSVVPSMFGYMYCNLWFEGVAVIIASFAYSWFKYNSFFRKNRIFYELYSVPHRKASGLMGKKVKTRLDTNAFICFLLFGVPIICGLWPVTVTVLYCFLPVLLIVGIAYLFSQKDKLISYLKEDEEDDLAQGTEDSR